MLIHAVSIFYRERTSPFRNYLDFNTSRIENAAFQNGEFEVEGMGERFKLPQCLVCFFFLSKNKPERCSQEGSAKTGTHLKCGRGGSTRPVESKSPKFCQILRFESLF